MSFLSNPPFCCSDVDMNPPNNSNSSSPDYDSDNNFAANCFYSPDGTCVLTRTEADNTLRIYEPSPPSSSASDHNEPTQIQSAVTSKESSSIYDYCWYPLMDSSQPASCVFLSSARDNPLHMYDAYYGSLRATYRAYDGNDEIVAANSVCFTGDGTRIFAGYKDCIRVFATDRPGKDCEIRQTTKSKKTKAGQKGLISSISFNNHLGSDSVYAAGSYSGSIYLYDDRLPTGSEMLVSEGETSVIYGNKVNSAASRKKRRIDVDVDVGDSSSNSNSDSIFKTAKTDWYQKNTTLGITQLSWSPQSDGGFHLFSSSRRGNAVIEWDMRMLGSKGSPVPIAAYCRDGDTNQRMQFDFDSSGTKIFVGSKDREVKIYDVGHSNEPCAAIGGLEDAGNGVGVFGCSCGPGKGGLKNFTVAVATGQRHYHYGGGEESESEDGEGEKEKERRGGANLLFFRSGSGSGEDERKGEGVD